VEFKPIIFPDPGKLEGIKLRSKPVMSFKGVKFRYAEGTRWILEDAKCNISLNARTSLIGANGAGKTTFLRILIGDLELDGVNGKGELWRHHNLRMSYVAQHSMHHLEENLEKTPVEYLIRRFHEGLDKEINKLGTVALTPEEEIKMNTRGEVAEVVGRVKRGKQMWYEILRTGRKEMAMAEFKSVSELTTKYPPYVMKLCRAYDERQKAETSGMALRPVTTVECLKHLADFGLTESFATEKIRWLSGGQKSRLVLAAAFWSKPHLIALDEPTNYLDNETLAALTKALATFKGAVLMISHNDGFVGALCKELLFVHDGVVDTQKVKGDYREKREALETPTGATPPPPP